MKDFLAGHLRIGADSGGHLPEHGLGIGEAGMQEEKTAGMIIIIIAAGKEHALDEIRPVGRIGLLQERTEMEHGGVGLDHAHEIERIIDALLDLILGLTDGLVTVAGEEQEGRGAKLMRHGDGGETILLAHAAPEAADQAAGREKIIPVLQDELAAEEAELDQKIMLLGAEEPQLGREGGEHPDPQILHGMEGDGGGFAILPGVIGKVIEDFRILIGEISIKETTERKACKILLASLQLIGP
jgi:hypothetical protein